MKMWVVLLRNKRLMEHFFLGMSYRGPAYERNNALIIQHESRSLYHVYLVLQQLFLSHDMWISFTYN